MSIIVNSYRSKLRILLILYFFSEKVKEDERENTEHIRKFKSEVRIQKIDFLIRYPDYLSAELLWLIESNQIQEDSSIENIKNIIKKIFGENEPEIKRDDMLRYFYGAYEDIDDIISFLVSVGFIDFKSKRSVSGKVYEKEYYLTVLGINKIENDILTGIPKAIWYKERCELIGQYFGDLSGTELKVRQYQHEEYRNTPLNEYINGIQSEVISKFSSIFGEELD